MSEIDQLAGMTTEELTKYLAERTAAENAAKARIEALNPVRLKNGLVRRLGAGDGSAVAAVTALVGESGTVDEFLDALNAPSGEPATADTLDRLDSGDLTVVDVFTAVLDEGTDTAAIDTMAVSDIITSIPRIATKRAAKVCDEAGVEAGADLSSLTRAQVGTIVTALGDAAGPVDVTAFATAETGPVTGPDDEDEGVVDGETDDE